MEATMKQFAKRRAEWLAELEDLFAHIGRRFGRREMQERAGGTGAVCLGDGG